MISTSYLDMQKNDNGLWIKMRERKFSKMLCIGSQVVGQWVFTIKFNLFACLRIVIIRCWGQSYYV